MDSFIYRTLGLFLLVLLVVLLPGVTFAGNIDPALSGSQFAWGENIGWVNFEPDSGPGVTVTGVAVMGFAWGENIGWLNMNPTNGGVVNDGLGNLSGFGWGENIGWVNFAPTNGGVSINACGEFSGRVWGENIGWISLRSDGPVPFGVTTAWTSPIDTVPPLTVATPTPADPGWLSQDVTVLFTASDCGIGVDTLHYTLNSDPEVSISGSSTDVTINQDGIHTLSFFSVDGATNTEAANELTVMIDKTAPVITLTTPANAMTYTQGQNVLAAYTAVDALSGMVLTIGSALIGDPIDTFTLGVHTFTVTATDQAGNVAMVEHTYFVEVSGNIDPGTTGQHFAYGENVGWVNFQPNRGPGVTVTDTALMGFAWGENLGWINLQPVPGGVLNDGAGNLSGHAWAENAGWVSFSCPTTNSCDVANYGVTINPATGEFSGQAWGENIGWISFESAGPTGFGVDTGWQGAASVPMHIDATALTGSTFDVQGVGTGLATGAVQDFAPPASNYVLSLPGVVNGQVPFTVTGAPGGPIIFDASMDGFVSGRGTDTLVITGFLLSVDGQGLAASTYSISGATPSDLVAAVVHDLQVLPGTYTLQPSSGTSFEFEVTGNGTVDFDATLDSVLSGRGTTTLTILEVPGGNIDPGDIGEHFAYGENVGWINVNPSAGQGVTVSDTAVTGLAWGENIGWVNFNPSLGGVMNDGAGNLSGYAWSENKGWINFSCTNLNSCNTVDYGVTIDPTTGKFSGKAWGENIGWISFRGTGAVAYGVTTSWREASSTSLIQVDATALTSPTFTLQGFAGDLDTNVVQGFPLPIGAYAFSIPGVTGEDFSFTVNANTTVGFDPSLDGYVSGRGTDTLIVTGFPISVEGQGLTASTYSIAGAAPGDLDAAVVQTIQVIPGTYTLQPIGGTSFDFSVKSDGNIDFDVSLDGFLSGRGTSTLVAGSTTTLVPTNVGQEFIVGFPQHLSDPVTTLHITGEVATSGTVSIPDLSFTAPFTVTPNTTTTIALPTDTSIMGNNIVSPKGILITAADDIAVFGTTHTTGSTDGFLGLPTTFLGTDYFVLSYPQALSQPSQLLIVGTQDNTQVTVTSSVTTGPITVGTPFNVALDRLEGYQLQTDDDGEDLSGTVITASAPIAVFVGGQCATIPSGTPFCDHLLEQIPPTTAWGQEFYTVPFASRAGGDIVRVLASKAATSVQSSGGGSETIGAGQFLEFDLASTASQVISANKPVLVMQYAKGSETDQSSGDPLSTIIPPRAGYRSAYTFTTPVGVAAFEHFLNVVVATSDIGSCQLDGGVIPSGSFTAIGTSVFSGAQLSIAPGAHTVNCSTPLGGWVYGFVNTEAYGYPIGFASATSPPNIVPIADAGPDQVVNEGTQVILNGSGSTDDNDPLLLTYDWQQFSPGSPQVVLDLTDPIRPTFVAPEVEQGTILIFSLVVTDEQNATSTQDLVNVTITNTFSGPPGVSLTNMGREFIVGFSENVTAPVTTLHLTGEVATSGTVAMPGLSFSTPFTITPNTTTTVTLPADTSVTGTNVVSPKGILVTALDDIAVFGTTHTTGATDGFLGLPTTALGTDYVVLSYPQALGQPSQFLIVSTQDNTQVTVTSSEATGSVNANTAFNVALDRLDVYQLQTDDDGEDLSGTVITASAPIAVFVGGQCATIPSGTPFCDHLLEQIPPTTAWGQEFYTVPFASRAGGDIVRVLASEAATSVQSSGGGSGTIGPGQFLEFDVASTASQVITANNPVLVMQYAKGSDTDQSTGDPLSTLIPPRAGYRSAHTFTTPVGVAAFAHTLNVVVATSDIGSCQLDGGVIPSGNFTAIGTSVFSGAQLSIAPGAHTVNCSTPLGGWVYGFVNTEAYGYPIGFASATSPPNAGTFFTVTTNDDTDDGNCDATHCSLREAIHATNNNPGPGTITFAIGTDVQTIMPTSALPTITDPVIIDGTTQPGFVGTPIIELNGSGAGGSNGLHIMAGNSTIRGLIINRFGAGIFIDTNGGNVLEGNYIGTNVAGTSGLGNSTDGVFIQGVANNQIGGNTPGTGNLISGNNRHGVIINGVLATGNVVEGNSIGTNAAGTGAIMNTGSGVVFLGAPNNTVGGITAGARNIISGNNEWGVRIDTAGATGNMVQGNYIGTDVTGAVTLGNAQDGVLTLQAPNNTIGGTIPGAPNVISGNGAHGVALGSSDNLVQGNFIGTDVTGTLAVGNGTNGFGVGVTTSGVNNVIGGTTPGAGNVISGNTNGGGIRIGFTVTSRDTQVLVQGNLIGTDVTGTVVLGNTQGVFIQSDNNTIGGTDPLARNVISGNIQDGVRMVDGATGNLVQGNYIGTDVNGTVALGNSQSGVVLFKSGNNSIGGTALEARNIISGNGMRGVVISQPGADNNTVQGNYIGTDATGTVGLGNSGTGVEIGEGLSNTIGGTTAGAGNVIANNKHGIQIFNGSDNMVQGNFIGTDATGLAPLGNDGIGVEIATNSTNNVIGGTTESARNIISANGSLGVIIWTAGVSGNLVQGNFIGTDVIGTSALGNTLDGVQILDADHNTIGGTDAGAGNVISGNNRNGVALGGATATDNAIQGNFIGIDQTGTVALPNAADGIGLNQGATNNLIGGTTAGARNVISGNMFPGVNFLPDVGTGNRVQGNYIGLNAAGNAGVGNGILRVGGLTTGILIFGTSGQVIGGTTPEARNVISGNTASGIVIANGGTNHVIQGNYIGTNAAGTEAIGNGADGILISTSSNNTIGGADPGTGNVIAGNQGNGVKIFVGSSTNNVVQGNLIGTDATGTVALGNAFDGVQIAGALLTTIGGTETGARNIISGNQQNGVSMVVNAGTPSGNKVQGNYIGTDITGTVDLGNTLFGVTLIDVPNNTIGGTAAGARNVISGNNASGIEIRGNGASGNTVEGNYIGTDVTGTAALANSQSGFQVTGPNNRIGGVAPGAGNLISGNGIHGIFLVDTLVDPGGDGNVIQGNLIGTDLTGGADVGNGGKGIRIQTANNLIGGNVAGARNVISGNNQGGVFFELASATNNQVQGNQISTNGIFGVSLETGANNNTIGGLVPGEANDILANGLKGVSVLATAGTGNAIQGNSVFSHSLGIDLGNDGVTPNDPDDSDVGPNNLQNFPVLNRVIQAEGNTIISGTLHSVVSGNFTLNFFGNSEGCHLSGFGEGEIFLGSMAVTTDAEGFAAFVTSPFANLLGGGAITSTATDAGNNTSEFSACFSDGDGDGITDVVDADPGLASTAFTDASYGGITTGAILDPGTQLLTIAADPSPSGIRVLADASGGAAPASLSFCGGEELVFIEPGDEISVQCGSISLQVITGAIEMQVQINGQPATVNVGEGDEVKYDRNTGTFDAPSTNVQPVTVELEVGGQPTTVNLSGGNEITINAAQGTFTTPPDNPTPVVVMVGDKELTVEPGQTNKIFSASQDSYLNKSRKNSNEGVSQILSVGKVNTGDDNDGGGKTRTVVAFDLTDASLENLTKATLMLSISGAVENWKTKNPAVNVHRILEPWTEGNGVTGTPSSEGTTDEEDDGDDDGDDDEGWVNSGTGQGVTWNCATDMDISNKKRDCGKKWKGGTFDSPTAPGVEHVTGMTDDVKWDVTTDVLAGAESGWILIREKESKIGLVQYYSKEGAEVLGDLSKAPQLLLEFSTP